MLDIRYWINEDPFQNFWLFYRTSNIQYLLKQGGTFCREALDCPLLIILLFRFEHQVSLKKIDKAPALFRRNPPDP
jgi:hypothetical protein